MAVSVEGGKLFELHACREKYQNVPKGIKMSPLFTVDITHTQTKLLLACYTILENYTDLLEDAIVDVT